MTRLIYAPLFQYIQQNIRSDCSNIDKILEPPEGQDEGVWKYEHLRWDENERPCFLRWIIIAFCQWVLKLLFLLCLFKIILD